MKEAVYTIPAGNALKVLKALSNDSRLRIMALLKQQPMSISEIARELKVSQPTVTTYVNQLEEAHLISTRLQRASGGYNKLCFPLHDGVCLMFDDQAQNLPQSEYSLDMPVGHYSAIDLLSSGLLATEARIIASEEDTSRFFHPIRMEAELLVIREGIVRYLFPYNIPDAHRIHYLELSTEISLEREEPGVLTDITFSINDHSFHPVALAAQPAGVTHNHRPDWYPPDLAISGDQLTWRVDERCGTFNGQPFGELTLADLNLKEMQPIEVAFQIQPRSQTQRGVAIFGKKIGRYNQDIRLRIAYDPSRETSDPGMR